MFSADTALSAEVDQDEETYLAMFWRNDLIWDTIMGFLHLPDLSCLSLVNKDMNDKVRNRSRLSHLYGQTISGNLLITNHKLCRVKIELEEINDRILNKLAVEIFKDTEHLELLGFPWRAGCSPETKNLRIIKIISSCPNLMSFKFSFSKDHWDNVIPIFTNEEVRKVMANLKELNLQVNEDCNKEHETGPPFNLFEDLQLKLFKFNYMESLPVFNPKPILGSSQKTIVELKLQVGKNELLKDLPNMMFHHLKSFSLEMFFGRYVEHTFLDEICLPFLKNHVPTLTEFVLIAKCSYYLQPYFEILKHSKKIKLLKFKTLKSFESLEKMNWNFLESMSTLKCFKLHKAGMIHTLSDISLASSDENSEEDDCFENVDDDKEDEARRRRSDYTFFLQALPSNIKSIGFQGFQKVSTKNSISVLINCLTRFENLCVLQVTNCSNYFNDDILQFICSNLKKLQILKAEFDQVSDFGIGGLMENGRETGISIQNLKGLRKLKIIQLDDNCSITWKGLLCSAVFLELRILEIIRKTTDADKPVSYESDDTSEIHGSNFLRLIRQNPSLEYIQLPFYYPEHWVIKEMKKINPRLK